MAQRFLESVDAAFDRLRENPRIGSPRLLENRRLLGLRSWPVPTFDNVCIFYLEDETAIRVVRVLHGMMDTNARLQDE